MDVDPWRVCKSRDSRAGGSVAAVVSVRRQLSFSHIRRPHDATVTRVTRMVLSRDRVTMTPLLRAARDRSIFDIDRDDNGPGSSLGVIPMNGRLLRQTLFSSPDAEQSPLLGRQRNPVQAGVNAGATSARYMHSTATQSGAVGSPQTRISEPPVVNNTGITLLICHYSS